MRKGAVELGIGTIVILALALLVIVAVMFFFYTQFVVPAGGLSNYSSNLNISLPNTI